MGRRVTGGPLHFSTLQKPWISRDSLRVKEILTVKMAVFRHFLRI
jgi:hypothetical protein